MSLLSLIVVALALSMDNFAIALAVGASQTASAKAAAIVRWPLIFGGCSFVAPLLGWLLGSQIVAVLRGYSSVVVFATLAFVGLRMLWSAWNSTNDGSLSAASLAAALGIGVATSVDSLAVGFGLAMINVNIVQAAAIIGSVTAVATLAGVLLGGPIGRRLGAGSRVFAGLVLVIVGLRALAPHP